MGGWYVRTHSGGYLPALFDGGLYPSSILFQSRNGNFALSMDIFPVISIIYRPIGGMTYILYATSSAKHRNARPGFLHEVVYVVRVIGVTPGLHLHITGKRGAII